MKKEFYNFSCVENETVTVADCCGGEPTICIFSGLQIKSEGDVIHLNTPVQVKRKGSTITLSDSSNIEHTFSNEDLVQSISEVINIIKFCNEKGTGTGPVTPVGLASKNSVTGDGLAGTEFQLVNDEDVPAVGYIYKMTRAGKAWAPNNYTQEVAGVTIVDSLNDTVATKAAGTLSATVQNVGDVPTELKKLCFDVSGDNDLDTNDEFIVSIAVQANADASFPYNNSISDMHEPILQIVDITTPNNPVVVALQADDVNISAAAGVLSILFKNLAAYETSSIKLIW